MLWVRTFLTELHAWQWLGIFVARLTVGSLFFLSGRGKLFVPERREQMRQTLLEARVPFPEFNAFFVSTVEFVFGSLLLVGLATPLACLMLGGVMILYLPEVLCLVILAWLFLSGPGWFSVDHLILSRIRL
ncbi:MAG: DoxX family protein [Verrucomicrobia bacterium]|nr:MAG: DoxX family protein [Verrucomicrobiota bacterium]